ncbi:hypothetical protein DPMN_152928 [Dreissena polymorpha]|uniref:Uncharacterized protein n=1 Tax=Dreissena polymorpha TaxID=45954 RepID=A0A9D4FJT6_DREPO|nr:hypothetical protein DPMN_152928 [Dreissena polymorpha]
MKRSASLIDIGQRKLSGQQNSLSAADTGFESSHADSSMSTTKTGFKSFYADGNMWAAFTGHGSSHADSSMSTTSTGHESSHVDSSMSTTDTGQESLQSESGMSKTDTVHKILHANSCLTGFSEQQKENVFGQTTGFVSSVDKDQSCCDTSRKTTEMFYVPSSDPETSSEVHVLNAVTQDNKPKRPNAEDDKCSLENDCDKIDDRNISFSLCNCKRCTHAHNTDESDGCHGEVSTEAPYTSSEHIIKEFTCIKHCIKKIEKSIVNQSLHGSAPDSADSSSQSSVEGQDEDRNQRAFNNGVNLSSSLKKGQVRPDNHCSNKITQASNQTPAPLSEFPSESASNTHFTPVSTAEAQVVPYSTEHAQASARTALEGISPHHQSCHSQHATLPNQICRFCLHQLAPRVLESEQYLRSCPYLYSLFRSRQAAARQRQRPHYNSEGDSHQQQIIESIHYSSTYPILRDEHQWIREDMSGNDDLNTAGNMDFQLVLLVNGI